jgi:hypothetical protein
VITCSLSQVPYAKLLCQGLFDPDKLVRAFYAYFDATQRTLCIAGEDKVITIFGTGAFWALEVSHLWRWFYPTTAFPKSYKATRLAAHTTNDDLVAIFQKRPRLAPNCDGLLTILGLFKHATL